eukprot:TRINITY_DN37216_c0_g1_i1.p1 TRINITY_DN37216_c0_g1~~TRINITY_DN37216_c0_g1_i1.p1  ORF type:complete len:185 (+),score=61.93 TRINITY_DN37216_c0_g1_i1:66-620(+)
MLVALLCNVYSFTLFFGFAVGVYAYHKLVGRVVVKEAPAAAPVHSVQKVDCGVTAEADDNEVERLLERLEEGEDEICELRDALGSYKSLVYELREKMSEQDLKMADLEHRLQLQLQLPPSVAPLDIMAPSPLRAVELVHMTPPSLPSSVPSSAPSSPNSRNLLINNTASRLHEMKMKLEAARRM